MADTYTIPNGISRKAATIDVEEVEYHRNGVAGEGFHVVKFQHSEDGPMLAVVFDSGNYGTKNTGRCAVFNRDLLREDNITFGQNSWRGDIYEDALRHAIKDISERKYANIS